MSRPDPTECCGCGALVQIELIEALCVTMEAQVKGEYRAAIIHKGCVSITSVARALERVIGHSDQTGADDER